MSERRVAELLPHLQFLFRKSFVVVFDCGGYCIMVGIKRLHNDASAFRTAPRPTSHLCYQLKRPLRRAKIGYMKRRIRRDDAYECNVWDIKPLCYHLRDDQNVHLAMPQFADGGFVVLLLYHTVAIHSR